MNNYMVKRIDVYNGMTVEDYWNCVAHSTPHYCKGLQEVWKFCGGKLKRGRTGYCGTIGNTDYIAIRV